MPSSNAKRLLMISVKNVEVYKINYCAYLLGMG